MVYVPCCFTQVQLLLYCLQFLWCHPSTTLIELFTYRVAHPSTGLIIWCTYRVVPPNTALMIWFTDRMDPSTFNSHYMVYISCGPTQVLLTLSCLQVIWYYPSTSYDIVCRSCCSTQYSFNYMVNISCCSTQ